nr:putative ribonuclease H-like domain-containing protein [Tanacetum cinerariifolium]
NKPNVEGSGPTWLFDTDSLTRTMNYQPVTAGNQSNPSVGFQDKFGAEKAGEEIDQQYVLFPVWSSGFTNPQNTNGDASFDGKEPEFDAKKPESKVIQREFEDYSDNNINEVNDASIIVPTVGFQPSDGYHVVLPPYTRTFMPPKPNLIVNTAPTDVETDRPAFTIKLSPTKPAQDMHSVQHVEPSIPVATPKPASLKPTIYGKRRNRKACFVYKSLDHLIKDCDYHATKMAQPIARNHAHRGNHKQYASLSHTNPQKHMVSTAVLTKSKPVPIIAVRPISTAMPKFMVTRPRHVAPIVIKNKSPIRRHITRSPSPKVDNSSSRVTVVKALVVNAAQGNMSYLSDFEVLKGGYDAFGGNPKGGKITRKGKIRTGKLDFDDVYFVKELKFNLFSVSQICDKKNSVLFSDTKCIVLSSDFKLPHASQVLLRVPRENNMYNVNLKNIIPSGDLTCLFFD